MALNSFNPYKFGSENLLEIDCDHFPGSFHAWNNSSFETFENGTTFGYVYEGCLKIESESGSFTLKEGMYFCIPGKGKITGNGKGILIFRREYLGMFQLGGPIENDGRLKYIDGCTDSLLIPPVMKGDPCLNLLKIPRHTNQTQHTHPSYRLGLVVKGRGECRVPGQIFELEAGVPFYIPKDAKHSFFTEDEDLFVIAYHPDSDFGPTHENHPMLNKTIINKDHYLNGVNL